MHPLPGFHRASVALHCQNRITMLASIAAFALLNTVVNAQITTNASKSQETPGPIQVITDAQFNQMSQSGVQFLPITPAILAAQNQQTQATLQNNLAVVNAFISQNPNLQGIAGLFAPPVDPKVVPTIDGNYSLAVPDRTGKVETIQTMGPATILADLAASIQAAADPIQLLAQYQSLYSQYAALYVQLCPGSASANNGCGSLTPPSRLINPAVLQNASLGSIKSALQGITSQGIAVLKQVPIPPGSLNEFRSCSGYIGASTKADQVNFGDEPGYSTCSATPNPAGIVANFDWLNKDLLTCVKGQGGRGTCHIFAAISGLEELIARDTGDHVNLSEQDYNEFEKLRHQSYFREIGNPLSELNDAASAVPPYQFAYENQWDYNPRTPSVAKGLGYACGVYPYPAAIKGVLEPGCSDSAPQAPEWCVAGFGNCSTCELIGEGDSSIPSSEFPLFCGFTVAKLSGARSPYTSAGAFSIWDHSDPDLSVLNIILNLALNNAVLLSFSETPDFHNASRTPAQEKKDNAPTGYVLYDATKDAQSIAGTGGHVVHIVGYIDNGKLAGNPATKPAPAAAGGAYFIIKNSWGVCKGDVGYYYMPVDYMKNRATGVSVVAFVSH